MAATVSDVNHAKLEEKVLVSMKAMGYTADTDLVYHHNEEKRNEQIKALARSHSPTARGIRARADMTFTHQGHDICVSIDAKSNSGSYPNMVLELEPACRHYNEAVTFGDHMLYVYYDARKADDKLKTLVAMWAHDLPQHVTEVHIDKNTKNKARYVAMAQAFFPDAEVKEYQFKSGNYDPFVKVPYESLKTLNTPGVEIRSLEPVFDTIDEDGEAND